MFFFAHKTQNNSSPASASLHLVCRHLIGQVFEDSAEMAAYPDKERLYPRTTSRSQGCGSCGLHYIFERPTATIWQEHVLLLHSADCWAAGALYTAIN